MDYRNRCFGNKPNQELYANYHDNEWGIPKYDYRELFELLLILEGAQAS
ncbi:MAG: DNA-3-methyladenine glycosylase I [Francisella endosymbiont of Hyalomma asiaticum]